MGHWKGDAHEATSIRMVCHIRRKCDPENESLRFTTIKMETEDFEINEISQETVYIKRRAEKRSLGSR